jgi:hypothetical protein
VQALIIRLKTLWYSLLLLLKGAQEPSQYSIPSCNAEDAGYWNDVAPWQRQLLTHLYRFHTGIKEPDPRWFGIHGIGGPDDPPPHYIWNAVVPMSPALVARLNLLGYQRMVTSVLPALQAMVKDDVEHIADRFLAAHHAAIPATVQQQVEAHRRALVLSGLPPDRLVSSDELTRNLTILPDPPLDPETRMYTFTPRSTV